MSDELYDKLREAIRDCDADLARKTANDVVAARLDVNRAIQKATQGIREVGDRFSRGEAFLPHLIMAGDAMSEAMKILEPMLSAQDRQSIKRVRIVFGTVKDDIHDIGKNIVGAMFRAETFEVHDIGKDVPAEAFIQKAKDTAADIIAASALMTVTVNAQKELIEETSRLGLRNRFKVIVGGGATTSNWAKEIGADGFGKDAVEAVAVVKQLLGMS